MKNNLVSKKILVKFLVDELGSDQTFFQKQLGHFLKHLTEFKTAVDDPAQLGRCAHKIRSGCHCFGAVILGEAMQKIELKENSKELRSHDELLKITIALIDPTIAEIKMISTEYFKGARKSA